MERAVIYTTMVTSTKETLKKENLMDKETIFIAMALCIKANGKKAKNKAKVYCILKKEENLKDIFSTMFKMELGFT